jgi:hypothetical protein
MGCIFNKQPKGPGGNTVGAPAAGYSANHASDASQVHLQFQQPCKCSTAVPTFHSLV